MAYFGWQIVFVPTGFLIPGHLKPRPLQARRNRKTISYAGILLVIEIPGLAVGRGNERGGLAKIRADGRSRLRIRPQQAGRPADPDSLAGSPVEGGITLVLEDGIVIIAFLADDYVDGCHVPREKLTGRLREGPQVFRGGK